MNYALIENEIVTNIIWLLPNNVSDFPNAIPTNDLPVQIGDTYVDDKFYRDGIEITLPTFEDIYIQGYDQALVDLLGGEQ